MLTIVYDPQKGHACPDGRVKELAAGAASNHAAFGEARLMTSSWAVVDAIAGLIEEGVISHGCVQILVQGRQYALSESGSVIEEKKDE